LPGERNLAGDIDDRSAARPEPLSRQADKGKRRDEVALQRLPEVMNRLRQSRSVVCPSIVDEEPSIRANRRRLAGRFLDLGVVTQAHKTATSPRAELITKAPGPFRVPVDDHGNGPLLREQADNRLANP